MKIALFEQNPITPREIDELFYDVYNKRLGENYWKWRYWENPFDRNPSIVCAIENNKLIAFYGISTQEFIHNSKSYFCGLMTSGMTHPKHREGGAFNNLTDTLHNHLIDKKEHNFFYGFANHNSHRILRKHMGWKDIFMLNNFYADSNNLKRKLIISNNLNCAVKNIELKDIITISEFENRQSIQGFGRSFDFLKWRILNNPLFHYKLILVSDSKEVLGGIIFKEFGNTADIMEIFYRKQNIFESVLNQGLFILANHYTGINTWANLNSEEHLTLEKYSFFETQFNTYLGWIQASKESIIDREKIHFRFIDSDVF